MKFSVEHTFTGIDLPAYEALYFDEPFNVAMCEALGLRRTLVALERGAEALRRSVKIAPQREVPAPVAKVLGAAEIAYTEHVDYRLGRYAGTWNTVASVLTDKVDSRGSFAFEARGGGVLRRVEGTVQVKIFGLGAVVERFVGADIGRTYAQAAAFTQRWIDGQRP